MRALYFQVQNTARQIEKGRERERNLGEQFFENIFLNILLFNPL